MAAKNDNITKDPVAAAKKSKRGKARKTIIKEMLEKSDKINNIDELKEAILQVAAECLESPFKRDRQFAVKELAKYIFAQKSQSEVKFSGNIIFQSNPKITDESE